MAQPFPYLDESVRLVGTPQSRSIQDYASTVHNSPCLSAYAGRQGLHYQQIHQSPSSNVAASYPPSIFRMSSRHDPDHQPRHYFFYISVICMLYCVIYRLFFYYFLWEQSQLIPNDVYLATIEWILFMNGFVAVICLSVLMLLVLSVTIYRIHDQCSPDNVQRLLCSLCRLCVLFLSNMVIVVFADSFILFSFISYILSPSSSSKSHRVDMFWQSVRKYLKDADYDPLTECDGDEKMKRLIAVHYYCMNLYIEMTKRFSNQKQTNPGLFGRKQQQKAIQRLRPIVYNEYHQRSNPLDSTLNFNRFGISTPQSLSSVQRSKFMHFQESGSRLQHYDLHVWFSCTLWMPVFLNDTRYHLYWVIEKILLRIALVIILVIIIFAETKYAMELLPIPTVIRCCLEVINLLNLLPFVIYDDADFDNIAGLYASRELSTAIGRKRKDEINKEVNAVYFNYCKHLQSKQQQMMAHNPMNHSMTPPQHQHQTPQRVNGNNNNNNNESRRTSYGQNNMIRLMMPGTSHSMEISPGPIPNGLHNPNTKWMQQEVLLREESSESAEDERGHLVEREVTEQSAVSALSI